MVFLFSLIPHLCRHHIERKMGPELVVCKGKLIGKLCIRGVIGCYSRLVPKSDFMISFAIG
jgi:hypothetical protein